MGASLFNATRRKIILRSVQEVLCGCYSTPSGFMSIVYRVCVSLAHIYVIAVFNVCSATFFKGCSTTLCSATKLICAVPHCAVPLF